MKTRQYVCGKQTFYLFIHSFIHLFIDSFIHDNVARAVIDVITVSDVTDAYALSRKQIVAILRWRVQFSNNYRKGKATIFGRAAIASLCASETVNHFRR